MDEVEELESLETGLIGLIDPGDATNRRALAFAIEFTIDRSVGAQEVVEIARTFKAFLNE